MSAEFSSSIAMSILEHELELDSSPTPKTVHELVELYSNAIEHFESQQDPKYKDFQHRMHNMLARPEILHMLQMYNTPEKPIRKRSFSASSHRRNRSAVDITRESRKELLSQQVTTELGSPVVERRMKRLMNRHQNSVTNMASRTKQDLETQDLSLERRLAVRKNETMSRTMALISFEDSLSTSDKNFELDVSIISEEELDQALAESFGYEEKIEDIMELSFADKAARVADVRVKYEPQIAELQEQGSIGLMLLNQMKAQMDEEIRVINEEIDTKRKEDIAELKKMHNLSTLA